MKSSNVDEFQSDDNTIKKSRWAYAAEDLRIDPLRYIYQTSKIRDFLDDDSICYVCGLKGLGKTLLLKAKRKHFMNLPDDRKKSYVFIPSTSLEYDVLPNYELPEFRWDPLQNSVIWIQIWEISFGLSIISHFFSNNDYTEKELLNWALDNTINSSKYQQYNDLKTQLFDWTIKSQSRPSQFVNLLINNISKEMHNDGFLNELSGNILNILRDRIQSGCVIFIDQVDRAWEDLISSHMGEKRKIEKLQNIWYASQIGLIKSVYHICTTHHDIFIYASIRQEVLSQLYENDSNAGRFVDKMLILNYDKADLYHIFKKCILLFEPRKNLSNPELLSKNPIEAFLGFSHVKPLRIENRSEEEIFNYLYRHTIQRPRDLVNLGDNISKISPKERFPHEIQKRINEEAEKNLENDYLKDIENLMKTRISLVWPLISKNVFSKNELLDICKLYNNNLNKINCDTNCNNCENFKIFHFLYNIGLLGIIAKDTYNKKDNSFIQSFLPPVNRTMLLPKCNLPNSKFDKYLIHPVLSHIIEKSRTNEQLDYSIASMIIGDQIPYLPEDFEINENLDRNFSIDSDFLFAINTFFNLTRERYQKEFTDCTKEASSKSLKLLTSKLNEIIYDYEKIQWLDVGCGQGRCLTILSTIFSVESDPPPIHYDGIDESDTEFSTANEIAEKYKNNNFTFKFLKQDASCLEIKNKYNLVSAVYLLHEVDPTKLLAILKNMLLSLDKGGILYISDMQDPLEDENEVVLWDCSDIEYILKEVFNAKVIKDEIPTKEFPEEFRIFTILVRKFDFDQNKYDKFLSTYSQFLNRKVSKMEMKKTELQEHLVKIAKEIPNCASKNLTHSDLDELKKKIRKEDIIRAKKYSLLCQQILFLRKKIDGFEKGADLSS